VGCWQWLHHPRWSAQVPFFLFYMLSRLAAPIWWLSPVQDIINILALSCSLVLVLLMPPRWTLFIFKLFPFPSNCLLLITTILVECRYIWILKLVCSSVKILLLGPSSSSPISFG
jgi:hypothetical protein